MNEQEERKPSSSPVRQVELGSASPKRTPGPLNFVPLLKVMFQMFLGALLNLLRPGHLSFEVQAAPPT